MQKIGSFLKWLWSIISGGIHVGDKTDNRTTNDSSQKNTVVGNNNCITETKIESQYNAPSTINITVSDSRNVSIGDFSTKTFTLSSNAKPSCIDLSEQAKSILKTMAESGEERLATLKMAGKLEEIHMMDTNKPFPINDGIAIQEGIESLVEQSYLKHSEKTGSGNIYSLSTKGREYGKKLLEENRGNTSI